MQFTSKGLPEGPKLPLRFNISPNFGCLIFVCGLCLEFVSSKRFQCSLVYEFQRFTSSAILMKLVNSGTRELSNLRTLELPECIEYIFL